MIEDNPGDFVLIQDYLRENFLPLRIFRAETFAEAKAVLSSGQNIDVICLDLVLPDASGDFLVREILKLAGPIPVIVLTGYTHAEFSLHTLTLGATDYLLKDGLDAGRLMNCILYGIVRRRTYLQLEKSQHQYQDLFDFSPIPMFVCRHDTLEVINVNQSAIDNYGYSRDEFLTMSLTDIMSSEGVDMSRHQRKNGTVLFADTRTRAITFDGKSAMLVSAIDTTDRVEKMRVTERQNQSLRDITWMQSHLVRAPLSRMLSLLELIRVEYPLLYPELEHLQHLSSSAKELDAIVRDLIVRTCELEAEANIVAVAPHAQCQDAHIAKFVLA